MGSNQTIQIGHTDDGISLPRLEIILPFVQQVHQILAISLDIFISAWEWQILHLEPFTLEARHDAWVEIMRVGRYIETSWGYVPFILAPFAAGEIGRLGRLKRCCARAAAATPSREMLAQSIHCSVFLAVRVTDWSCLFPWEISMLVIIVFDLCKLAVYQNKCSRHTHWIAYMVYVSWSYHLWLHQRILQPT